MCSWQNQHFVSNAPERTCFRQVPSTNANNVRQILLRLRSRHALEPVPATRRADARHGHAVRLGRTHGVSHADGELSAASARARARAIPPRRSTSHAVNQPFSLFSKENPGRGVFLKLRCFLCYGTRLFCILHGPSSFGRSTLYNILQSCMFIV